MAVAVRGIGAADIRSSGSAYNLTPGLPDGWQPGDIHILCVEVSSGPPEIVTVPDGWTEIVRDDDASDTGLIVAWRRAEEGDSAPSVAVDDFSDDPNIAQVVGLTGALAAGDPIVDASSGVGFGATATGPSADAGAGACGLLMVVGAADDVSLSGWTDGLTELLETPTSLGTDAVLGAAFAADVSGATGSRSVTLSGNAPWGAALIAVAPAATWPTTPELDDFNRVEDPLSTNWQKIGFDWVGAGLRADGANARGDGTADQGSVRTDGPVDAPCEVWAVLATLPGSGFYATIFACLTEDSGYALDASNVGGVLSLRIYRVDADTWTQLGATLDSSGLTAGDRIGLTVADGVLEAWAGPPGSETSRGTREDSTYTSGALGLMIMGNSARVASFGGGEIVEPVSGGIWVNQSGTPETEAAGTKASTGPAATGAEAAAPAAAGAKTGLGQPAAAVSPAASVDGVKRAAGTAAVDVAPIAQAGGGKAAGAPAAQAAAVAAVVDGGKRTGGDAAIDLSAAAAATAGVKRATGSFAATSSAPAVSASGHAAQAVSGQVAVSAIATVEFGGAKRVAGAASTAAAAGVSCGGRKRSAGQVAATVSTSSACGGRKHGATTAATAVTPATACEGRKRTTGSAIVGQPTGVLAGGLKHAGGPAATSAPAPASVATGSRSRPRLTRIVVSHRKVGGTTTTISRVGRIDVGEG